MTPSRQDQVWNRAALESGGIAPGAGDAALAALLFAHGLIMNGGVEHALECMNANERSAAMAGYRYFGLEEAALALESAARAIGADSNELDEPYWRAVPEDGVIAAAFRVKLLSHPTEFSSVEGRSHA